VAPKAAALPLTATAVNPNVALFAVTSRVVNCRFRCAVAPLETLAGYVAPFVERGAQALLLKGQDVAGELTTAAKYWRIEADLVPSKTDSRARIVVVRRVSRILNPEKADSTPR